MSFLIAFQTWNFVFKVELKDGDIKTAVFSELKRALKRDLCSRKVSLFICNSINLAVFDTRYNIWHSISNELLMIIEQST